jgi:hypothetical protein
MSQTTTDTMQNTLLNPMTRVDRRTKTASKKKANGQKLAEYAERTVEQTEKLQIEKDLIEPTVEWLVIQFHTFGKVEVEHLIRKCETVAQAKAKLDYNGYGSFCEKVGLNPKSPTTRKYQRIGAEADWLLPIAEHLPPDWTTVYDVVKLGKVKAEELIRLGILHPQATAKELKAATIAEVSGDVVDQSKADETIGAAELCVFQVDASDLSDQDRLSLYHVLEEEAARHGCVVKGLPDRLAQNDIIEREAAR